MPTFAETMVTKYEDLLAANAGVVSVNVDGRQVALSDLEAKYLFWKSRVAKEAGTRPNVAQIDLSDV